MPPSSTSSRSLSVACSLACSRLAFAARSVAMLQLMNHSMFVRIHQCLFQLETNAMK